MTLTINELQEEFDENDIKLDTIARDSVGETAEYIPPWFDIDIDVEDAIGERNWLLYEKPGAETFAQHP